MREVINIKIEIKSLHDCVKDMKRAVKEAKISIN